MTRMEHLVVAAIALGSLAGCGRDAPADGAPAAAPQASAAPASAATGDSAAGVASAPTASAADASASNRILDPATFADARTRAAYAAARKYASVLEGLYCYCHCKENLGHRALAECFETDHAAGCDICQTEAVVAARMSAEGRSVKEIQQAIDALYAA